MKIKIILFALLAIIYTSCNSNHEHDEHDHDHDHSEQEHDVDQEADEDDAEHADDQEHEDHKIQFTTYNAEFELFAEADPFIVGKASNVLSHFTNLADFKALDKGSITLRLVVSDKETTQTLKKPTRKGIYSFTIKPEHKGIGSLIFDIKTDKGSFKLTVPNISVYTDEHEADHSFHLNEAELSEANTFVFTKEQSWKIDFSTELPKKEVFGQVIKTTGQIQSAQGDEIIVSAKTNGMIKLSSDNVLEGKSVSAGKALFSISGNGLADNNSSVRFLEAKNNFERTRSEYERSKELAKDKIVSEKALLKAKNEYDNARVIYNNLSKNFNSSGQTVTSPMSGFVKQLFVQNGQYVEPGQAIVSISKNKTLLLRADVQQKYASILGAVKSANIRTLHDNKTYTLEKLNGKLVSFGKQTNSDNYLIPVSLQIDNKGSFFSGGFVELYLKTITNTQVITIPNSSILEEQGVNFVYVQITPELFEKREVKLGASDALKTEVLKGLNTEERIVSIGAINIKLAQATGTLDAHSGHVH